MTLIDIFYSCPNLFFLTTGLPHKFFENEVNEVKYPNANEYPICIRVLY